MTERARVVMRQVSSGTFRGVVVVDSTLDHFLQKDGNPDTLFQHSGSLLKSGSSTRSTLVNPDFVSGDRVSKTLYVKEFRYKGVVHSLKHLFLFRFLRRLYYITIQDSNDNQLKSLAEGEGFEPSTPISQGNRLAGGRTKPLCDPSVSTPQPTVIYCTTLLA